LEAFTPVFNKALEEYLRGYKRHYQDIYNQAARIREAYLTSREAYTGSGPEITQIKNNYFNQSIADLVTRVSEKKRIVEHEGRLIQQVDPVFQDPTPAHALDYRAHFFAPQKNLLGNDVSTYWFNVMVIWLMTLLLYATLYTGILRRAVNLFVFSRSGWRNRKLSVR
jgi:hypothetical protein